MVRLCPEDKMCTHARWQTLGLCRLPKEKKQMFDKKFLNKAMAITITSFARALLTISARETSKIDPRSERVRYF